MTEPSETSMIMLYGILRGGIVTTPEVAIKIAELMIESLYSPEDLAQQKPFVASDQSDRWVVEGSYNKDKSVEGRGPARVVIAKKDARIIDFYISGVMVHTPEQKEQIRRAISGDWKT